MSLPYLKDQPDCPPEIECMNVSLTPVNMYNLLMHSVLATVEDKCNCMTDLMPADPKKLVKQVTKIETKLKLFPSKMKPEDHQNGNDRPKTCRAIHSCKRRAIVEADRELKDTIPWEATKTKAKKQCKICEAYGGASYTHHTTQCKRWGAGRKSHKEWKGNRTTK